MNLKPYVLLMSLLSCGTAVAEKSLQRDDFAYATPLTLQGEGPVYELSLPLEVYRSVGYTLADVRVFNGAGEPVSYALTAARAPETSLAKPITLPLFPLRGDEAANLNAIKVYLDRGKAVVSMQAGASKTGQPHTITAYILDAREVAGSIQSLELSWADDAATFSTRVSVSTSDDLGQWRDVSAAPIASLEFNGRHLLQQRIEFAAQRAKYWRIAWPAELADVQLTQVQAQVAREVNEPTRIQLDVMGAVANDRERTFDYVLPVQARIDRFNVQFPQRNTYAGIETYARNKSDQPWRLIANSGMYELAGKTPLRNADIAIGSVTDRYWRLVVNDDIGSGVPVLQIAWMPYNLSFIARGEPPFELAYGNAAAASAATPIDVLLGQHHELGTSVALLGKPVTVAGPAALAVMHPRDWKTWILWAVLALAIAVLARMAFGLSRQMNNKT